jgi:hypothetical protein
MNLVDRLNVRLAGNRAGKTLALTNRGQRRAAGIRSRIAPPRVVPFPRYLRRHMDTVPTHGRTRRQRKAAARILRVANQRGWS